MFTKRPTPQSVLYLALAGLVFCVAFALDDVALGNELVRPTSFKELSGQQQDHYYVPGSVVAWADYVALKRDYPNLRGASQEAIDQWILLNGAIISKGQLQLQGIRIDSHAVDLGHPHKQVIHPSEYMRASVTLIDLGDGKTALLDLKGSGFGKDKAIDVLNSQLKQFAEIQQLPEAERAAALDQLRIKDHSDGMMTLGEALAEVTRQRAVQAEFDLHPSATGIYNQTVENYFVIALPFRVLKDHGASVAAAVIGRQAHWRGSNLGSDFRPEIYSDDHGGKQATIFGTAIDFGGVFIEVPGLFKIFGVPTDYLRPKENSKRLMKDAQSSPAWTHAHETAASFDSAKYSNLGFARAFVEDHINRATAELRAAVDQLPPLDRKTQVVRYLEAISHFVFTDPGFFGSADDAKNAAARTIRLNKTITLLLTDLEMKDRERVLRRWTKIVLDGDEGLVARETLELLSHLNLHLGLSCSEARQPELFRQIVRIEKIVDGTVDLKLKSEFAERFRVLASRFPEFAKAYSSLTNSADLFLALRQDRGTAAGLSNQRQNELLNLVDGRNLDQDAQILVMLGRKGSPTIQTKVADRIAELISANSSYRVNQQIQAITASLAANQVNAGIAFYRQFLSPEFVKTAAGQTALKTYARNAKQISALDENLATALLERFSEPELQKILLDFARPNQPNILVAMLKGTLKLNDDFFRSPFAMQFISTIVNLPFVAIAAESPQDYYAMTLARFIRARDFKDVADLLVSLVYNKAPAPLYPLLAEPKLRGTSFRKLLAEKFDSDLMFNMVRASTLLKVMIPMYGWNDEMQNFMKAYFHRFMPHDQREIVLSFMNRPSISPKTRMKMASIFTEDNEHFAHVSTLILNFVDDPDREMLSDPRYFNILVQLGRPASYESLSAKLAAALKYNELLHGPIFWKTPEGRNVLAQLIRSKELDLTSRWDAISAGYLDDPSTSFFARQSKAAFIEKRSLTVANSGRQTSNQCRLMFAAE